MKRNCERYKGKKRKVKIGDNWQFHFLWDRNKNSISTVHAIEYCSGSDLAALIVSLTNIKDKISDKYLEWKELLISFAAIISLLLRTVT